MKGGLLCFFLAFPAAWCFSCVGISDGVYEKSCKTFVTCVNGAATFVECQGNMVSNGGTLGNITCVDADTVEPPCGLMRDCTNLPDGRYADETTNCTSYFTCHNSYYYGHNYCAEGLVYDETLSLCNWPNPAQPCKPRNPLVG